MLSGDAVDDGQGGLCHSPQVQWKSTPLSRGPGLREGLAQKVRETTGLYLIL